MLNLSLCRLHVLIFCFSFITSIELQMFTPKRDIFREQLCNIIHCLDTILLIVILYRKSSSIRYNCLNFTKSCCQLLSFQVLI